MRAIPIPDYVIAANPGSRRLVIGPDDPTGDTRPVEYMEDRHPDGTKRLSALVVLDDTDRERIRAGANIFLTMYGGAEVEWSMGLWTPETEW